MIENDTQRRVLGHCMVPRSVGDITRLLGDEIGVVNLDNGRPVSEINVREVIQDLEKLGCVKSFYGVNPHALNRITELDEDVIDHPAPEKAEGETLADVVWNRTRGEIWADRMDNPKKPGVFQPDAPYYLMTQDAFDWISSPGPDVPPEHEGLAPGPVIIGMQGLQGSAK